MARIRTIKPAAFKDEELFDAEAMSGLPLRWAFAGLWTVADRRGRFVWQPRRLKSDVLPYDDVSFVDVLTALESAGFICRYEVGNQSYGWIPGFQRHQIINHREEESRLPPHPEDTDQSTTWTREARVIDASGTREARVTGTPGGKGTGREQEGNRKGRGGTREARVDGARVDPVIAMMPRTTHAPGPGRRGSQAFEWRASVPAFLHQEFIRKMGGAEDVADLNLRAWYRETADAWGADTPIGDDDLKFWRSRFTEWQGTTTGKPRQAKPTPTFTRWCRHEPKCADADWHAMRVARGDPEVVDEADEVNFLQAGHR